MDALLVGAELDDVPISEVCGSRLVGLVLVVVVPSEEMILTGGVPTWEGSIRWMVKMRAGKYVPQGMPGLGSMPPSHSVNPRPHSNSAWSKRYLKAENSRYLLRSM